MRNGLRHHDLRLDATPPPGWGDRFSLRGRFVQPLFAPAGDWRRWDGTVHADLPRAEVSELRRHVALPVEVSEGEGALRAWIDVVHGQAARRHGRRRPAQRDGAARARPGADVVRRGAGAPRRLSRCAGAVAGAQGFGFVTGEGVAWPPGDFAVSLRRAREDAPVNAGEFSADRLDLALMARVAARVPLGSAARDLLDRLSSPQGVVQGLSVRWSGPLDAPQRYQLRGRAVGLGIAPTPSAGRPRRASGDAQRQPGLRCQRARRPGAAVAGRRDDGVPRGIRRTAGAAGPLFGAARLAHRAGCRRRRLRSSCASATPASRTATAPASSTRCGATGQAPDRRLPGCARHDRQAHRARACPRPLATCPWSFPRPCATTCTARCWTGARPASTSR